MPELQSDYAEEIVRCEQQFSPYLLKHQVAGAELGMHRKRHAYFYDTGTGKTVLGIELIKQKKLKTLVIAPLGVLERAWMDDLRRFAPELRAVNVWALAQKKSGKARIFMHQQIVRCQVALVNFETYKSLKDVLVKYEFKMLLIDESSKIKNIKSQITKDVIKISDSIEHVYLFSGTPAPNNEMEYWTQIRALNKAVWGVSFYGWRNKYFDSFGYGGYYWKMKEDRRRDFLSVLSAFSTVVQKNDVLDLPERTFNTREVFLSSKEAAAHRYMKTNLAIELGDKTVLAANAAVKVMKLREITSGFIIDEDSGLIELGNSKLNELESLLEEIGNHQVIIWTHFHHEAEAICRMLEAAKKTHSRVDGTVGQSAKDERVKEFMNGGMQYLIAHPASIGHGVTLTNCNYAVYFSLSHSYELFAQSMDRIYRYGQKNACSYYFLCARDSIDGAIVKALLEKRSVVEAVFEFIKSQQKEKRYE